MKILLVIPSFRGGGAERIFIDLANALSIKGHDVTLVALSKNGEYFKTLPQSLPIKVLNGGGLKSNVFALADAFKESQADIIISALTHINIGVLLAKALSRVKSRVIVTEHNPFNIEKRLLSLMPRLFSHVGALISYRYADAVVAVSEGVKQSLVDALYLSERKVSVIYNPINVNRVLSLALDTEWSNSSDMPAVVTVGRLVPQKRHDVLLRSVASLKQEGFLTRLLIIGEGPLLENLQSLAKELEIVDQVSFLGFLDNPFEVIRQANVFALSSDFEGFGNVLVEALALGVPVVSTDCEVGPSEILSAGEYGSLVKTGDVLGFAQAIRDVLERNASFDKSALQERARQFDLDVAVGRYETLMTDIQPRSER